MTMLLFIALLLFAGALLCELFQRRLEETLPLAASIMTLLLLIFALAGALRAGATAVLALCVLCLPASLVLAAKRGGLKALFKRLFTPAALIYLLLCAAVILANIGKPVQTWDEFTYWADAVKIMSLNGTLPTAQAARSLYASYPPALPLWEFLSQRLNELLGGSFDEPLLFMSYQCLMLAFFMPFLRNVRLRRPLEWLACAVSVPLCVLVAFPAGLNMLHSDMMLGIMGGFACAWPLLFSPRSRFSLATQCAAVSMLVLIKDAGLLYALAGVLAFFLCLRADGGDSPAPERGRAAMQSLWPLGCALLACMAWRLHVAATGAQAQATFSNPISLSLLLTPEGAWRKTTLRNFLYRFFQSTVTVGDTNITISYFVSFVLLAAGFAALYAAVRKTAVAKRLHSIVWLVFSTTVAYIIGTGITYVFKFYEDEAVRMASYARYLNIAVLAVGFVLFACVVCLRELHFAGGLKRRASALALAAFMLFAPGNRLLNAITRLDAQAAQQSQEAFMAITDRVRALSPTGQERIYIVAAGSGGFEYYVLRYRLRPLYVGDEPWNPIYGRPAEDRFMAERTPDELRACLLEGYDLLVLAKITDEFAQTYGELFEAPETLSDGLIYRVDREKGLLVPAEGDR